ncbi:MAG TPA: DUF4230 domain-containing protein [Peptostreptococcaceae bacterium]|nr:DUF4230 domain-containing protein [Peptostreptococcaceae bacterium]
MVQKVKKTRRMSIIFITLICVFVSIFGYKYILSEHTKKNTSAIMDTIYEVLEITTTKYNYTNIVTFKKDKTVNNVKIPFTEKSFIVKYNGVIKAGINGDDIKVAKNTGDTIDIQIKKCVILDHYIDQENVYVYDIKNSIFNKLTINEVFEELNKYKDEYEKQIMSEGFVEEIKKNTESSLKTTLKNIGYKQVNISFIE